MSKLKVLFKKQTTIVDSVAFRCADRIVTSQNYYGSSSKIYFLSVYNIQPQDVEKIVITSKGQALEAHAVWNKGDEYFQIGAETMIPLNVSIQYNIYYRQIVFNYSNEDIHSFYTISQITNNEMQPVFDMFPSSGQITIADNDLSLYNQAISGAFDNTRYIVQCYINNKIFATHLIYQQPTYDYTNKTLTWQLGDILDYSANYTYNGYDYPFVQQSLYIIAQKVLNDLYGVTQDEFTAIMAKPYRLYPTTQSFGDYFNSIIVTVPYMAQNNYRNILRQILTLAQCCLIIDKNGNFEFVNTRVALSGNDDYLADIVCLTSPKQTLQQLDMSLILQNRYNQVEVKASKTYDKYDFDTTVATIPISPTSGTDISETISTNYVDDLKVDRETYSQTYQTQICFAGDMVQTANYKTFSAINIPEYSNGNLTKILRIKPQTEVDGQMNNLVINEHYNIEYGYTKARITYLNDQYYYEILNYFTKKSGTTDTTYDKVISATDIKTSDIYVENGDETTPVYLKIKTQPISFDRHESFGTIEYADSKFINNNHKVLTGDIEQQLYSCVNDINYQRGVFNAGVWNISQQQKEFDIPVQRVTITRTPLQINFAYYGNQYSIVFEDTSIKIGSGNNPIALNDGGQLVQFKSTDTVSSTKPYEIGTNVITEYDNGVHTGSLTVIGDDYENQYGEQLIEYFNGINDCVFKCGDLICPINNQGLPIFLINNAVIIFKVMKRNIEYDGGAFIQYLTVKEIKLIENATNSNNNRMLLMAANPFTAKQKKYSKISFVNTRSTVKSYADYKDSDVINYEEKNQDL